MPKITFINTEKYEFDKPVPASQRIPMWYKNMRSYMFEHKKTSGIGTGGGTIKKCMPVFDAMTGGYILPLPTDIALDASPAGYFFEDPLLGHGHKSIDSHDSIQFEGHPENIHRSNYALKFNNPWIIRTPKGYSCLFVTPMHQDTPLRILPGIVDTDSYDASPINFPFFLKDETFAGIIPAGTPMVQVIPFKRESWTSEVTRDVNSIKVYPLKRTFLNSYKDLFWHKKSYK
jgi:hypothetical protein